ncbi:MAG TPA: PH domain-containing protein [Gemmatimonadaceae bacterium]|nr:PH domain-containing protein [Gemmatimonadaceae bacterium]
MTERAPFSESTEQTVWQGSPSQAVNLPVYMTLGIGIIVATIGLLFLRANTAPSATTEVNARSIYPWIIVALWVLVGAGALLTYLKVSTTKYVLTTERLRVTTGILSTVTEDLELRRVRDSVILRPFWARVAGLGHVQIMSADASTPRVMLHAIKDPDGVQTKIRSIVQTQWAKFNVRQMEID